MQIETTTIATSLLGGALVGVSLIAITAVTGRRVGVSGLAGDLLAGRDRRFAGAFLAGMVVLGAVAAILHPEFSADLTGRPVFAFPIGGLLIGWGARRANGCTTGHGVLGVSRFSARSVVAVALFAIGAACAVAAWPTGGAS